ncbi:cell wall metabolism sensor histidine kinase WalK [Hyphomonas sp.]|uniref:sensor histidine kinase n=1 Tax=Hyphomonas sp. TaxID=87 RepID=UPI0025BECA2E|nr:HAMP domain-containing sensor histidine kinase [Hyphomonas sp.]
MIGRGSKLRTQLSFSMIMTAFVALGVFCLGMISFYLFLQKSWLSGLSDENRATLQTLMDDGTVSSDALTTLISTFSFSWSGGYAQAELAALITLVILAALCAVVIGLIMSKRMCAPIETVTDAALEIANGNFTLALPQIQGGAAETEELVKAFRTMTDALSAAERETMESSAAIAHELRTPLTILRGRLQGLNDGAFEPSKEMTDSLIAQVDTLSGIVDELSLLSRLSAGKFELQAIEIDLVGEVQKVVTPLRPDLESLGLQITLLDEPVKLIADPVRIRQALTALIDNVKHYAASGQHIEISTYKDGMHGYIEVSDRGPGIDPVDHENVFQRWWRGDESRNRAKGGTGLGLSVVKSIIEAHGGKVSASTNAHGGATFTLCLPLPGDTSTVSP